MTIYARAVAWLDSRAADVIWKTMAFLALVASVLIGARQYEMTTCQAHYNEASNISQRARAEAAAVDRLALDRLLGAIADRPQDAIPAIRAYNVSRGEADAQRARNPVPAPPSETCG
jgi:hypothetical protein